MVRQQPRVLEAADYRIITIEENAGWLEVSVDDAGLVDDPEAFEQLPQVLHRFLLGKASLLHRDAIFEVASGVEPVDQILVVPADHGRIQCADVRMLQIAHHLQVILDRFLHCGRGVDYSQIYDLDEELGAGGRPVFQAVRQVVHGVVVRRDRAIQFDLGAEPLAIHHLHLHE